MLLCSKRREMQLSWFLVQFLAANIRSTNDVDAIDSGWKVHVSYGDWKRDKEGRVPAAENTFQLEAFSKHSDHRVVVFRKHQLRRNILNVTCKEQQQWLCCSFHLLTGKDDSWKGTLKKVAELSFLMWDTTNGRFSSTIPEDLKMRGTFPLKVLSKGNVSLTDRVNDHSGVAASNRDV